jgi:hypothetical protein
MSNTIWLSKALRWLFTFSAAVTALFAVSVVVLMLVDPKIPAGAHFGPATLDFGGEPGTVVVTPEKNDIKVEMTGLNGAVRLSMDQGGGFFELLKHYGLPILLLNALFFTALFDLLRRLFRNVGRGDSFTPQTVRFVQIIGFGLLVFSLVSAAAQGLFEYRALTYLADHTAFSVSGNALHLPHPDDIHFGGGPFGSPIFFSGLLVLALSEVFRQGLALKRESDLTV